MAFSLFRRGLHISFVDTGLHVSPLEASLRISSIDSSLQQTLAYLISQQAFELGFLVRDALGRICEPAEPTSPDKEAL